MERKRIYKEGMTDRVHSLTVVLDRDVRVDDAKSIVNALKMVKGVVGVTTNVTDLNTEVAYMRARTTLEDLLWEALRAEDKKRGP